MNQSYLCHKLILILSLFLVTTAYAKLPYGFVYLHDIDASIVQEIRYAGHHNFIGRPIMGYKKPVCIITRKAAKALKKIQAVLNKQGYSLKVYDCYRPKMAVHDMYEWSKRSNSQPMRSAFFPRQKKSELFKNGYIALYSGHSRGSTVDLTIVDLKQLEQPAYNTSGQPLSACYVPTRFKDNSIDMGTEFDCFDKNAYVYNKSISPKARQNRLMLQSVMKRYGFKPYPKEWWHFTLRREPYREYFNFPVS